MENYSVLGEKLYVYQHRIDALHNKGKELVEHCKSHPECEYYLFAKEKKSDGTPHFQGIVFLRKPLNITKERQSWANVRTKKWVLQHKQSVSFTAAKNPKSLAKYCNNKEELGIITNLTTEQLEKVGKWKSVSQLKLSKRKTEDHVFCQKLKDKLSKCDKVKNNYYSYIDAFMDMADIAYDVYERPPPMRSLILNAKIILPKQVFLCCLYRELQR